MKSLYETALEIQKNHIKVIPFNGNRPAITAPKDNATLDNNLAHQWWATEHYNSIGVLLEGTGILMLDIDVNHASGADGTTTLKNLAKDNSAGTLDTYWEKSPSGGLHLFYSYDPKLKLTEATNLFAERGKDGKIIPSGIDYNAVFVPVAPSRYRGGQCEPCENKTWADIKPAPQWLLDEIQPKPEQIFVRGFGNTVRMTGVDGKLLNRIVAGIDQGGRNVWATSIVGSLYRAGATPETVMSLMLLINENYIRPSLSTKELGGIIRSITAKEVARQ
ncbi:bifunctional DNA primase/polymerase [Lacticaseibacillus jixiensis]|uniref:bifunctional DNA primase/polymerase n=1 Tax=Lacticaseibacillus jixiensis TaxID=3231926 RepID=UPI0036F3AA9A